MKKIHAKVRYKYVAPIRKHLYVARPVRYSLIPHADIVQFIAEVGCMTRAQAAAAAEAYEEAVRAYLCQGHSVDLGALGILRFSCHIDATEERSQMGTECVGVRRVLYRPSDSLRRALQEVEVEFDDADA